MQLVSRTVLLEEKRVCNLGIVQRDHARSGVVGCSAPACTVNRCTAELAPVSWTPNAWSAIRLKFLTFLFLLMIAKHFHVIEF